MKRSRRATKLVSFKIDRQGKLVRIREPQEGRQSGKTAEVASQHRLPLWLEATIAQLLDLAGKDTGEDDRRRRLYEVLLRIDWLPSKVRGPILKELGASLRQQRRDDARLRVLFWRHLINKAWEEGRTRDEAIAEIAERVGIEPESVEKELQRRK
jgi:hypothetical protein